MKKIIIMLILAAFAAIPGLAHAADPDMTLRREAPIYTGPVDDDGDLEELTEEDFAAFGTESDTPEEQYRRYKKVLAGPSAGSQVLYKMRIIDRDLTLDDFLGFDVPEKLSQARYDGYLSMNPATVEGRTIHYVYVYHKPLAPAEEEVAASDD